MTDPGSGPGRGETTAAAGRRRHPVAYDAVGDVVLDGGLRALLPHGSRGGTSRTVTDLLRRVIREGEVAPGAWLREAKLAGSLGISRTPVRDALRTLAAEGFVELHTNKGAVVRALTTDDILELYAVRATLEGLAARLAARRASKDDVSELQAILERMEGAAATAEFERLAEEAQRFHEAVRRAAGNHYLDRSLAQISHAVHRFRHHTYELAGRSRESVSEHRRLADAIAAGDPVAAERIAADHIRSVAGLRVRMLMDGS